ncbi:MAG: tetratricopeptide repeat protein [Acidimicrobiia bacterium]
MLSKPPPGTELPTGTVTFLLTDVEGSTRLWQEQAEAQRAFARHDEILRREVSRAGGHVVKGTGDGLMTVFASAQAALRAAVGIQQALAAEAATLGRVTKVRIALHTGEADEREGDYFGTAVNRCSRLLVAAHGGQVLLSAATEEVLGGLLPHEVGLRDLGTHGLADLERPERIFQVLHPELVDGFPSLRGVALARPRLPLELTSFVGRANELAEIDKLLRGARLVSLTGVGGSGKSRLAMEAARALAHDVPDGVWLVELDVVGEAELVLQEVARALGVAERPDQILLQTLEAHLAGRKVLLIFDNCEHLLDACAALVDALLRACPDLRVLATSREPLGVPGEVAYEVPPMSLPAQDDLPPDVLGDFDAVRLFGERAELARPEFRLTEESTRLVAQICRSVDGIPLALELAAAKLRVLPLHEIAGRLEDRFRLLTGGGRTVLPRRQTLRATMDWSFSLLSEEERVLLARLASFSGGFELGAAEAVCGQPPLGEGVILDGVVRLVEKSLVVREGAVHRYRLLETVRQYAAGRLAERGEEEKLRRSHAEWAAGLARRHHGRAQDDWLDRLDADHDNLRAALRWALDTGEMELALRIGEGAWMFWKLRGHLSEGRSWLEQVLESVGEGREELVRAGVLLGSGDLAATQGDLDRAAEHLEEALALARRLGDERRAVGALARLAGIPHKRGDLPRATALFEEALVAARRNGDRWDVGHVLCSLALLLEDQGDHRRAEELAAEAVSAARETGETYLLTDTLLTAGELALNRGEGVRARGLFQEALTLAREAGITDVVAWGLCYLGKLAAADGEHQEARSLLEGGLAGFRELGSPAGEAWALRHLGWTAADSGDLDGAQELLREALRRSVESVRPDAPLVLELLGMVQGRRGRWTRAAKLMAAGAALRLAMGLRLPLREQAAWEAAWELAVSRLEAGRIERLVANAEAMTLEEAAAFALG